MNLNDWTDEQQAVLERLAAQGCTAREIGDAIGKSRNAVIGRAGRMKVALTYRAPPPEPRAPRPPRPSRVRGREWHLLRSIVREMYLAGDIYAAIEDETGYTAASIVNITKDLPRRRHADVRKRYPKAVKVSAVVALLTGERPRDIHQRTHIPREAVRLWSRAAVVLAEAQPIADAINAEREATARTEAAVKAQAEARERMWIEANNAEVYPLMSERHADMMRRRAGGQTLEEVGGAFGLTRERVRQIEVRWRLKGLIVPGAKPITEASKAAIYVPTGAPRGRKPKHPKVAKPTQPDRYIDFWQAAAADLDDEQNGPFKRGIYRISPEVRAARSQRMRDWWAAKRAAEAAA